MSCARRHKEPVAEFWRWDDAPPEWQEGLDQGGDEEWIVYVRCPKCAPWILDYVPEDPEEPGGSRGYVEGLGWTRMKRFGEGHLISFARS